jgi:hypothetical protein
MNRAQPGRRRVILLTATLAVAASGCVPAAPRGQSQVVEGVRFHYGLVAEPPRAAPRSAPASARMHGGPPAGPHTFHVVLNLTNAETGKGLAAAEASMGVRGPGHPGRTTIAMEPMMVNGQKVWGHLLTLPRKGPYVVEFRVRSEGAHRPVTARFELTRPA